MHVDPAVPLMEAADSVLARTAHRYADSFGNAVQLPDALLAGSESIDGLELLFVDEHPLLAADKTMGLFWFHETRLESADCNATTALTEWQMAMRNLNCLPPGAEWMMSPTMSFSRL